MGRRPREGMGQLRLAIFVVCAGSALAAMPLKVSHKSWTSMLSFTGPEPVGRVAAPARSCQGRRDLLVWRHRVQPMAGDAQPDPVCGTHASATNGLTIGYVVPFGDTERHAESYAHIRPIAGCDRNFSQRL